MPVAVKAPARTSEPQWDSIIAGPQFKSLVAAKKRFIVPAFLFFLVYYFALPLLAGYAPRLMSITVYGPVTLAYLAALSQFVVGGVVAALYVRAAANHDRMAKEIIEAAEGSRGH